MSIVNGSAPRLDGIEFAPVQLVADDSDSNLNSIPPLATTVTVTGVTNDADDYIVMPSLGSCPDGHRITILASAASNFELRTPSASAEEINSEECDGTKEALITDTTVMTATKINGTVGWMLEGRTAIGAYATAIVPD